MAYNFYQPQYYPAQQMPYQTQQQSTNSIIWVQGENAAKAYPVSAGQSVLLMDSENSLMYIKSTDQSGMPLPLRIFEYKEKTQNGKETPPPVVDAKKDYISREEFDKFRAEIRDEIRRRKKPDEMRESKVA